MCAEFRTACLSEFFLGKDRGIVQKVKGSKRHTSEKRKDGRDGSSERKDLYK